MHCVIYDVTAFIVYLVVQEGEEKSSEDDVGSGSLISIIIYN